MFSCLANITLLGRFYDAGIKRSASKVKNQCDVFTLVLQMWKTLPVSIVLINSKWFRKKLYFLVIVQDPSYVIAVVLHPCF